VPPDNVPCVWFLSDRPTPGWHQDPPALQLRDSTATSAGFITPVALPHPRQIREQARTLSHTSKKLMFLVGLHTKACTFYKLKSATARQQAACRRMRTMRRRKRKAKLKFVRTYSKYAFNTTSPVDTTAKASIRRPWEDIPRSTATSITVGCKVRSASLTAQCDQQEGVVNSTDQHEAVVEWTHPSGEHTLEGLPSSRIHPIVVGAPGHTQAEASIIDTKFKRSTKSQVTH
jgi:hypothetical protein